MGITPGNPGRKSREKPAKYDKRRYKRRNRIEIMLDHFTMDQFVGSIVNDILHLREKFSVREK